jgi:hypothetical protein
MQVNFCGGSLEIVENYQLNKARKKFGKQQSKYTQEL